MEIEVAVPDNDGLIEGVNCEMRRVVGTDLARRFGQHGYSSSSAPLGLRARRPEGRSACPGWRAPDQKRSGLGRRESTQRVRARRSLTTETGCCSPRQPDDRICREADGKEPSCTDPSATQGTDSIRYRSRRKRLIGRSRNCPADRPPKRSTGSSLAPTATAGLMALPSVGDGQRRSHAAPSPTGDLNGRRFDPGDEEIAVTCRRRFRMCSRPVSSLTRGAMGCSYPSSCPRGTALIRRVPLPVTTVGWSPTPSTICG